MRFALVASFIALCHSGCGGSTTAGNADAAPPPEDLTPPPPLNAAVTALTYDVKLDLSTRIARSDVTLRIDQPGNCVQIGFRPAAVMDVALDGKMVSAANVTLDTMNGRLTACRDDRVSWNMGDKAILSATAEVPKTTLAKSQVGYSTTKDAAGSSFTYLVSWLNGCDHHGPCDARPNQFAQYKFTVTHASGTQVLCPGTLTPGDTQTICEFALPGGPTYSTFGLAADPSWKKTAVGAWSGVDVSLYDYDNTDIAANFDAKTGASHMAWLQALLGPYPFGKELRFVVGPTYWLGFEHPGNILISEELVTQAGVIPWTNPLRHVTMHELTHQWAGDYTTLADTYDYFWKESVAEYLTYVFEDEQVGRADGAATNSEWKVEAFASHHYPVPTDKPALIDYYGDAYGEGPMILFRQLETLFSRKAVLDALKARLSSTNAPAAVSLDDFRAALEKTTGAQLTDYFNVWARGTGKPAWPKAKLMLTTNDNISYDLAVTVTTDDNVKRGCAFHVRLKGANGEQYDVPVNLGVAGDSFQPVHGIKPGFAVMMTVLDPDNECLIFPSTGPIVAPRLPPRNPWVAPTRAAGPRL